MKKLIVLAMLTAVLAQARADEVSPEQKKRAVELYRSGVVHYQSGDLEKAAKEFKESFQAYPKPETLYNLAQTHRLLKHYEEAVFFYKQFMATGQVREPTKSQIEKRVAELEEIIRQQRHAQTAPPQGPAGTESSLPATSTAPSQAQEAIASPTRADLTAHAPERPKDDRVYKRKWFWPVVAGSVVVAVGVGVGIGLGASPHYPSPTLGTVVKQ
jgi:tetratricopeptide (TPR) repeat protein